MNNKPLIADESGLSDNDGLVFPKVNGAYRVVSGENYTENFGYQWNRFTETQVDKSSHLDMSRQRFFAETGWENTNLEGENILEVGSGAGRFTQIILDHTKANLYTVDYSNAVEANYRNNGPHPRLHLFQASIYDLPFEKGQFDKVICLGVLQHTPEVEKSVQKLIEMARPGGEVLVDFYSINGWWTKIHAKYLLRPFTRKMQHDRLYSLIDKNIDWMIKASSFFNRIGIGKFVNRFIPICDIEGTLPKNLTPEKLREMCVLDTFDMFSPEHDHPQRISTVVKWFNKYGMEKVWGGRIRYSNSVASVVKGIKK